jgi:hypothetical protein
MFGKRVIFLFLLYSGMCFGQWVQVNSGPPDSINATLAVSGGYIFAGTLSGAFLSTNEGTIWTAISGLPTGFYVNISFAMSGSNIFAGTSGGVFLSTNNGVSWIAINTGLPATMVGFNFISMIGNNIFAEVLYQPQKYFLSNGLFLSTNNGMSWTAVDSGLANTNISCLIGQGSNIFAGTNSGVLLSPNNGISWTAVNNGIPASTYVTSLAVSGSNIFAGTYLGAGGVFLSTNNGTSWTAVDSGLTNSQITSFAVSGSNIFAGTIGGVFLSTNNGTSWTVVSSGLPIYNANVSVINGVVSSLAVSGSTIFAAIGNDGLWRRPLSEMVGVINPNPQQGKLKQYANGLKINVSKTGIALLLPQTFNNGAISVGLYTIAGKRIYSATHQAHNGTLNIPVLGLSTGTYLMSIKGNNTTLSSPFVVTK